METEILFMLGAAWLGVNLLFAGLLGLRARARRPHRPHLRLVHSQDSVELAAESAHSLRQRSALR